MEAICDLTELKKKTFPKKALVWIRKWYSYLANDKNI